MTNSLFAPASWSRSANIYEVNVRQYTPEGTFEAFGQHLPRLRDMGIEILWFMPITPISFKKRLGILGSYYACSNYTATNPEYGTVDDFRELVEKAHVLGFKVIIDWVANHTGADHVWTESHPDYFITNQNNDFFDINGWEDVIDLNYKNRNMQRTMIECMQFWIDNCNIDGFRCDMAHLIPLDFWRQARTWLDTKKTLFWLAETEAYNYHEVFDASYRWHFLHTAEDFYLGKSGISSLDESLKNMSTHFPPTALHLFFTSNHDENSHSGSEYERLGNAALPFAVLNATWNGIPLIYSGQELPNKKRIKFFDKDPIEWAGTYELHGFYKKLLMLRKTNSALSGGNPSVTTHRLITDASDVFAYFRTDGKNSVLVALNLSASESWFQVQNSVAYNQYQEIFSGGIYEIASGSWFQMKPWQYLVMEPYKNEW